MDTVCYNLPKDILGLASHYAKVPITWEDKPPSYYSTYFTSTLKIGDEAFITYKLENKPNLNLNLFLSKLNKPSYDINTLYLNLYNCFICCGSRLNFLTLAPDFEVTSRRSFDVQTSKEIISWLRHIVEKLGS